MQQVEIRIEGHLDTKWAEWFEGFTLEHTGDNHTLLTGCIPDPAALYGTISKMRDLGLVLISIIPVSEN